MRGSLVRPWNGNGQDLRASDKRPRLMAGLVEEGPAKSAQEDLEAKARCERRQALVRLVEQRRSEVRQIEEKFVEARKKLSEAEAELAVLDEWCRPKFAVEAIAPSPSILQKVKREPGSEEKPVNGATSSGKPQLLVPGISMQNVKSGPNIKVITISESPPKTTTGATTSLRPCTCTNQSESNLSSISSKQTTTTAAQPLLISRVEQSEPDALGVSPKPGSEFPRIKSRVERSEPDTLGISPKPGSEFPRIKSRVERSEPDTLGISPKPGSEFPRIKSETGCSLERSASSRVEGSEGEGHMDLIARVCSSDSPTTLKMFPSYYMPSQHKRKLRSLVINPTMYQSCATSALDGLINLWQVQGKGIGLSLTCTIDCLSPGQRRWPDDMVWHPSGESLFACYSADAKDHQVAIIDPSTKKANFLDDRPHDKGIINNIVFMPWKESCFVTAGCDHAVVAWNQEGISWKPNILHRSLHSSAVMGVAGLQKKQQVLSVGADKRIVGFDVQHGRAEFRYQLESKAMGVSTNPSDVNLFMVQTGTPGQQIRLFDIRAHNNQLHAFGWKQESSESQSALINQNWSLDGLYIASGSADPKIHIFDIRFNGKEPPQTIRAHTKRVFKAAWHHSLPLLISISSDLNIGLHRISV